MPANPGPRNVQEIRHDHRKQEVQLPVLPRRELWLRLPVRRPGRLPVRLPAGQGLRLQAALKPLRLLAPAARGMIPVRRGAAWDGSVG